MIPQAQGIYAMLYALFDADERLDRAAMRRQVEICIAAGVQGVAALGLATEVSKLSEAERLAVMDWAAEDVAGRLPLALTVFDGSVAGQLAQVLHAERAGADWVILQPPPAASRRRLAPHPPRRRRGRRTRRGPPRRPPRARGSSRRSRPAGCPRARARRGR